VIGSEAEGRRGILPLTFWGGDEDLGALVGVATTFSFCLSGFFVAEVT
jgi:hypothetical protein